MFYFKYQLKLEFIPYVQEEVIAFTSNIQHKLASLDDQQISTLRTVLDKKIKQIDQFYLAHYEDYRAHLALRIKDILQQFWAHNSEILSLPNRKQKIQQQPQQIPLISPQNKSKKTNKMSINSSLKDPIKSPKVSRFQILAQTKTKAIGIHPDKPNQRLQHIKTENSKQKTSPLKSPTSRVISRNKGGNSGKQMIQNGDKKKAGERNPEKKMSKQQYIKYLKSKKY